MNSPTESVILLVEGSSRGRHEKLHGLTQLDHRVIAVENSDQALNVLAAESPSVIISDLNAPGIDGLRLMGIALGRNPEVGVILMTDPGSMGLAVAAMKEGAYDVLEKPVYVEKLAAEIEKILDRQRIVQEKQELLHQLDTRYGFENIVGRSASMQRIREQILQIADTQSTVLIFGESGTGKELVAHALHHGSSRRNSSFVPVFCNALSEGVIESELFGHEKGAFTNAVKTYRGRFELADGGTLFLDEVGELSPSTQVKLLRVLQERKFQRVGSGNWLQTDTRVIAATNLDLEAEIESGRFREDLYYRLRVVTLSLPPLRERKEDLPLLIDHCIRRFGEREKKPIERIEPQALELLSTYNWPGERASTGELHRGHDRHGNGEGLDRGGRPGVHTAYPAGTEGRRRSRWTRNRTGRTTCRRTSSVTWPGKSPNSATCPPGQLPTGPWTYWPPSTGRRTARRCDAAWKPWYCSPTGTGWTWRTSPRNSCRNGRAIPRRTARTKTGWTSGWA